MHLLLYIDDTYIYYTYIYTQFVMRIKKSVHARLSEGTLYVQKIFLKGSENLNILLLEHS